jgi:transposase-like protein
MGKKRNQYTKEYKMEVISLIAEKGRPISEVACELGVAQSHCIVGKRSLRKVISVHFPGKGV